MQLFKHNFPSDIEGIFVEINLRKTKWLLFGTYHPPSQTDNYYFESITRALDIYGELYSKLLLVGDFNAEDSESCMSALLYQHNLKHLVKQKTCFKSTENPSCIDLFLTNCAHSFGRYKMHTTYCILHTAYCESYFTEYNKWRKKKILC